MLYLLFRLGNDRYALEANRIVEVIPYVHLQPLPQAPRGVAGVFNYHGMPVPAVDLSELVSGKPAPERLSTRIIVVNQHAPDGSDQLAGLIAEEATELLRKDPREFADPAINLKGPASLGPITLDTNRSIRWLRQDRLLPDSIRSFLCSRGVMPKPATDLTDSSVLEL